MGRGGLKTDFPSLPSGKEKQNYQKNNAKIIFYNVQILVIIIYICFVFLGFLYSLFIIEHALSYFGGDKESWLCTWVWWWR